MEIMWLADTNILIAYHIKSDRLNKVVSCIGKHKELIAPHTVVAEIRSLIDTKIAKLIAKYMSGNIQKSMETMDPLERKILDELRKIMMIKETNFYEAVKVFRNFIDQQLQLMQFEKIKPYGPRRMIDKKELGLESHESAKDTLKAIRKYSNKIFGEIMRVIDATFPKEKQSKDKEILVELIMTSYSYPDVLICFLTNDRDFFRKWKKVHDEAYTVFKEKNSIKYGIYFHYVPDLHDQKYTQYKMHPKIDPTDEMYEKISLSEILKECT